MDSVVEQQCAAGVSFLAVLGAELELVGDVIANLPRRMRLAVLDRMQTRRHQRLVVRDGQVTSRGGSDLDRVFQKGSCRFVVDHVQVERPKLASRRGRREGADGPGEHQQQGSSVRRLGMGPKPRPTLDVGSGEAQRKKVTWCVASWSRWRHCS